MSIRSTIRRTLNLQEASMGDPEELERLYGRGFTPGQRLWIASGSPVTYIGKSKEGHPRQSPHGHKTSGFHRVRNSDGMETIAHEDDLRTEEPQALPGEHVLGSYVDHIGGLTGGGQIPFCKHCGAKFSSVASEAFVPDLDADILEPGVHMALHHPDELRKTHPHWFLK